MQIDLANTLVHKVYFYLFTFYHLRGPSFTSLLFIARKLATPLLRRGWGRFFGEASGVGV